MAVTAEKRLRAGQRSHRRWSRARKWFAGIAGTLAAIILALVIAVNVSPAPGTALIKYVFEDGAADVARAMEPFAPTGVTSVTNLQYRPGDEDARLDVYYPTALDQPGVHLPTLVWTHGGAWVSGHKDDAVPYLQLIAVSGFTVISLDYSLAPKHTYPTPIHQVNDALRYIQDNADALHVDVSRIVMAGDSAGSQITSQFAGLVTNPEYAAQMDIAPALKPEQLRGVALFCGIYDMETFLDEADIGPFILGWGTRTVVWAYTGSRDQRSLTLDEMSTIEHVTGDFPAAFISGGNGDPLTEDQSKPLASKLQSLGVEVHTLFFPADYRPKLPHEYQFTLDNDAGQRALSDLIAFLKARTAS